LALGSIGKGVCVWGDGGQLHSAHPSGTVLLHKRSSELGEKRGEERAVGVNWRRRVGV